MVWNGTNRLVLAEHRLRIVSTSRVSPKWRAQEMAQLSQAPMPVSDKSNNRVT